MSASISLLRLIKEAEGDAINAYHISIPTVMHLTWPQITEFTNTIY